jgi:hypothetical protein
MYLSPRVAKHTHTSDRIRARPEEPDIMPLQPPRTTSPELPALVHAFAPLHKAAFGTAIGVACALVAFGMTALSIVRPPDPFIPLGLFSQYFRGYDVTWPGAFIGAGWAGFTGFVFGWFAAFCRNFVLAVSLFVIRTRADLSQTRDFLDHV